MQAAPLNEARLTGQCLGADRVVIIAIRGEEHAITTWGKDRAATKSLRAWSESLDAAQAVRTIGA